MVTVEQIIYVVPVMALTASILYYTLTIRNQNKTREAQLFMNVYNNHISLQTQTIGIELMHQWSWNDYDDFIEKYGLPNNLEAQAKWTYYFSSMEGLGMMLRKGLLDAEWIYGTQYMSIITIWEKFLPLIEVWRETAPQLYEDPEYLYNEMEKMRMLKGHPKTHRELRKIFYN